MYNENRPGAVVVATVSPEDFNELKEVLEFGFACQDGLNKSLADGEITVGDAPNLWPIAQTAGPALKNIGNPVQRYRNLSATQRAQLHAYAKQRFDLRDDDLEFLIEDTLEYGYFVVTRGVSLARRWQAKTGIAA